MLRRRCQLLLSVRRLLLVPASASPLRRCCTPTLAYTPLWALHGCTQRARARAIALPRRPSHAVPLSVFSSPVALPPQRFTCRYSSSG